MTKKVFGLSGGIGSGKSTLAKLMQKKYPDIEIFDCDSAAKKIMEGDEIRNELKKILGKEAGKIEIIFKDLKLKKAVEKLIHPKVWQKLDQFIGELDDKKIVLVETAILFETGKDKDMVKNIVTVCGLIERRRRIKRRSGWSDEQVDQVIKNQSDQEVVAEKADVVVDTECSLKKLEDKTEKLYRYLVKPVKEKLFL